MGAGEQGDASGEGHPEHHRAHRSPGDQAEQESPTGSRGTVTICSTDHDRSPSTSRHHEGDEGSRTSSVEDRWTVAVEHLGLSERLGALVREPRLGGGNPARRRHRQDPWTGVGQAQRRWAACVLWSHAYRASRHRARASASAIREAISQSRAVASHTSRPAAQESSQDAAGFPASPRSASMVFSSTSIA